MFKTPSEGERQQKKALEQLAYAHRAWMRKVECWKNDFEKAMSTLRPEGWIPKRDEDENILTCIDRGAAIKAGREKAKAKRQAITKAQAPTKPKMDKVNIELEQKNTEKNTEKNRALDPERRACTSEG